MVQIGSDTTPGLLILRCDSGRGPTGTSPVNGSTSTWANTVALLSVAWLTNALKYRNVDAFGESCSWTYQRDSSSAFHSKVIWQPTTDSAGTDLSLYDLTKAAYANPL